jgi:hypothetical protein
MYAMKTMNLRRVGGKSVHLGITSISQLIPSMPKMACAMFVMFAFKVLRVTMVFMRAKEFYPAVRVD